MKFLSLNSSIGNIKNNNIKCIQLNYNLVCCTFVRRIRVSHPLKIINKLIVHD